jgi:galactokinase
VQAIKKNFPFVKSLRDATVDMLIESVDQHHVVYARCLYVIQENERLQTACVDLKEGRMKEFGAKMFETHKGLSELYQVSCKELDFLVNQLKDDPNVLGARMMGGGFGGCTINLIKGTAVDEIIHTISENYLRVFNAKLKTYKVSLEGGTSIIERKISK